MKSINMFSVAFAFLLGFAASVFAQEFTIGNLTISNPYVRMTTPKAPVSGGYFSITNNGDTTDTLLSVSVDFSGKTEIHEMKMQDSVMMMRPIANGIEIPPGETVVLKPGGKHIMFMMLKEQLVEREKRKATLTFKKAGSIEIEFIVQNVAKMKMDHSKHKMIEAN